MSRTRRSRRYSKNAILIASVKRIMYTYRLKATKRGYVFDISYDTFFKLILSDCELCGAKPNNRLSGRHASVKTSLKYNGVDRIDNTMGYIEGNVRTCCKLCNAMKSDLKDRVFKKHVIRMAQKMAERKTTRRRS